VHGGSDIIKSATAHNTSVVRDIIDRNGLKPLHNLQALRKNHSSGDRRSRQKIRRVGRNFGLLRGAPEQTEKLPKRPSG